MDENPYRAPQEDGEDGNVPPQQKRLSVMFYLILALLIGPFLIAFLFDLIFAFMSR